jgi:hypothetical protein
VSKTAQRAEDGVSYQRSSIVFVTARLQQRQSPMILNLVLRLFNACRDANVCKNAGVSDVAMFYPNRLADFCLTPRAEWQI